MPYTPTETLMMQVIENLNNRLIPVNLPHEYESFLTPEVVNGIIEAMNSNDNFKIFQSYDIYPLGYYEGCEIADCIHYVPFGFSPADEPYQVQLPFDFLFTLDNTQIYYYGSVTMSRKLLDIEKLNRAHRYFHFLGFEPYMYIRNDGLGKYSGMFYTKKDYFPTATSSNYAKSNYPINAKVALVDGNPNDSNLRELFGFPPRPKDSSSQLFKIGSPINYGNQPYFSIKFFRAVSTDGLIIKPGADGVILPYYNKTLYYANPLYGYYDNYYDVKPFEGGGRDSEMQPLIIGTAYACGFKVVWFTDTEFWITPKYKLVYQDKRPIVLNPTLCCLAQCFGITQ